MDPATLPIVVGGRELPGRVALYPDRPPRVFAVARDGSLRELALRSIRGTPVVRLTVDGRQRSMSLARLARAWVRRGPPGRALSWDVAAGVAGLRWRDVGEEVVRGPGGRFSGRVAGGVRAELMSRARACVEANSGSGLLPSDARITMVVPPPPSAESSARETRPRRRGGTQ